MVYEFCAKEYIAVQRGRLEQGKRDPNDMLFGSAIYGKYEDAINALDSGANPNYITPRSGNSAIGEAEKGGHTEIVNLLIHRGARFENCKF